MTITGALAFPFLLAILALNLMGALLARLEPKGLARWRFSFPIAELYYLDVRTDGDGRVASVKPWRD